MYQRMKRRSCSSLASGALPRSGDRRVIRLIRKWLKAGVMKEGQLIATRPYRNPHF
jgi:hypothetical protein